MKTYNSEQLYDSIYNQVSVFDEPRDHAHLSEIRRLAEAQMTGIELGKIYHRVFWPLHAKFVTHIKINIMWQVEEEVRKT